jgi:hypothetical protein
MLSFAGVMVMLFFAPTDARVLDAIVLTLALPLSVAAAAIAVIAVDARLW